MGSPVSGSVNPTDAIYFICGETKEELTLANLVSRVRDRTQVEALKYVVDRSLRHATPTVGVQGRAADRRSVPCNEMLGIVTSRFFNALLDVSEECLLVRFNACVGASKFDQDFERH